MPNGWAHGRVSPNVTAVSQHSMKERLEELANRKEQAYHAGSEKSVARTVPIGKTEQGESKEPG